LKDEKVLLDQLDNDFAKSNLMVAKVMARLDVLFNGGPASLCCYVLLFTSVMVGLLIKFT
jgi:hypothetical protein